MPNLPVLFVSARFPFDNAETIEGHQGQGHQGHKVISKVIRVKSFSLHFQGECPCRSVAPVLLDNHSGYLTYHYG